MSHLANHTPETTSPAYSDHDEPAMLIHHADLAASHTWAMANQLVLEPASNEALYDVRQAIIRQTKGLQQALWLLEPTAGDRQAQEDVHAAGSFALCASELLQDASRQPAETSETEIGEMWDHLTASTVHRGRDAGRGDEGMHTAGFWGVLLSAFGRPLRAVCGASLVADTPPPGRGCRDCAQLEDGPSLGLMLLLLVTVVASIPLGVDAYQDGHKVAVAVTVAAAAYCLVGLARGTYLRLSGAWR